VKRSQSGFTIIEVLIVLAIAGLILLLVFLAIPQLQRNSRNSQRKNDVTAILEAVSHYELNHSGDYPDCGHAALPSCYGSGHLFEFSKLSFYSDDGQAVVVALSPGQKPSDVSSPNPVTDANQVYVYNRQKCPIDNSGTSTDQGAGFSDVVALFAIENATGTTPQCMEL
jgi:prepilin-type N-terminal cleavage/methylation domain-containing protein